MDLNGQSITSKERKLIKQVQSEIFLVAVLAINVVQMS